MHLEINFAVTHLLSLLQLNSHFFNKNEICDTFLCNLSNYLTLKYDGHWDPYNPCIGSAYRAITCFQGQVDDLVLKAGEQVGLSPNEMSHLLPYNFIIWVDPNEVSIRMGEYGYPRNIWSQKAPPAFTFAPKKSSPLRISSPKKNPSYKSVAINAFYGNGNDMASSDLRDTNQRAESLMFI